MKKIHAAACVVACCISSPAMAYAPICLDCSIEEQMRRNSQYLEMQRMEQRQQELEDQMYQMQMQEQRNRFNTY